ncbi:hypothetical protein NP493_4760g00007, partial [Ridgeia piscesae]
MLRIYGNLYVQPPSSEFKVLTSLDEARTAAHQREGSAIAKYNFKAQSPIELSLRVAAGRQLVGGSHRPQTGYLPLQLVDIINEPDTPLMTPQLTPRSSYACTPRTAVKLQPRSVASSTQNSYQREYIPSPSPSLQQRTQRSYGLLQESLNRARSPQPISRARSPQPVVSQQQAPQRIQNNYGTYRAPDTVTMNGSYSQKDSRLIGSQSPERRVYGGFKEPEGRGGMYKDSGPITTPFVQQKSHVTEASPHSSRDGHAKRYKEPIYPPASQKSPIPKDRFEENLDAASLERPKKKTVTKVRGKAKALYSFRAQNPRGAGFWGPGNWATGLEGSPGQLSPVSTMSNGPAPTIPSAPISPRMFDFDFDQQSNFSPRSVASSTQNSYQREYIPSPSPSLQQRTQRSYGLLQESLNRARSPQPISRARSPQPVVSQQQAPQRIQNNYGTYRAPDTVTMNGSYSQKDSRLIGSQSPERRVYGGFKEPEGRGG